MPVLAKWPGDPIQWSEGEFHDVLQSTIMHAIRESTRLYANGPDYSNLPPFGPDTPLVCIFFPSFYSLLFILTILIVLINSPK